MYWHEVQAVWDKLADEIQDRWPEVRALDIAHIAGDQEKFTAYLAEVHDLTPSEAQEAIDLWIYHIRTAQRAA